VLVVAVGAVSTLEARVAAGEPTGPPPPAPGRPPAPAPYTPYVDRGNAVPAPFAYAQPGFTATWREHKPTLLEGNLAFALGLASSVWIDGSVGTLTMAPRLRFHSVQVGPNVVLVTTAAFELDLATHVTFASAGGRPVEQIEPGVFAIARAAHRVRLDTGVFVDANPGAAAAFGLRVPASVTLQLGAHTFASVNTGVTVASFSDLGGTTAIPMGATFGWGDRFGPATHPVGILVEPTFLFPELIKPGAAEPLRLGYVALGLSIAVVSRLW
jgi:hypothetical protein